MCPAGKVNKQCPPLSFNPAVDKIMLVNGKRKHDTSDTPPLELAPPPHGADVFDERRLRRQKHNEWFCRRDVGTPEARQLEC